MFVVSDKKNLKIKEEEEEEEERRRCNSMVDADVLARAFPGLRQLSLSKILSADWPCRLCSMNSPNSTQAFYQPGPLQLALIRKLDHHG